MLTFTVIEIAPQDGYSIVRVQVGSASQTDMLCDDWEIIS